MGMEFVTTFLAYSDYYYDDGGGGLFWLIWGPTLFWCLVSLGVSLGFGFGCKAMARRKDFSETGAFWLGFFITWVGLIIVATRPDIKPYIESPTEQRERKEREDAATLRSGGWKCANCGKVNERYVATCGCGTFKADSVKLEVSRRKQAIEYMELKNREKAEKAAQKANSSQSSTDDNLKVAEAITKFKELKDMGVLSDEEFEERKKSLLLSVNDKKIPEPEATSNTDGDKAEKEEEKEWECGDCGTSNPSTSKCCSYCGKIKLDYYSYPKKKIEPPKSDSIQNGYTENANNKAQQYDQYNQEYNQQYNQQYDQQYYDTYNGQYDQQYYRQYNGQYDQQYDQQYSQQYAGQYDQSYAGQYDQQYYQGYNQYDQQYYQPTQTHQYKYCTGCGNPVQPGDSVCQYCGKSIIRKS